jgi:hypothetical protein
MVRLSVVLTLVIKEQIDTRSRISVSLTTTYRYHKRESCNRYAANNLISNGWFYHAEAVYYGFIEPLKMDTSTLKLIDVICLT